MPHVSLEMSLSQSRFSTFRNAIIDSIGEDSPEFALELYGWNAQISSKFFFPLHIYEVVLRNAISDAFALRYGVDWPLNQAFQNSLPYYDKTTLTQTLQHHQYVNIGRFLPEIKFVWFEALLAQRHENRVWDQYMRTVFPHAPIGLSTSNIRQRIKDNCRVIRKFRNRCGHHEPIFNSPSLPDIMPYINETTAWRCNVTQNWIAQNEQVSPLLNNPVL